MNAVERARELVTEVREYETRSVDTQAHPHNFLDLVSARVLLESTLADYEAGEVDQYRVKGVRYAVEKLLREARQDITANV